jgi:hypothetical protein
MDCGRGSLCLTLAFLTPRLESMEVGTANAFSGSSASQSFPAGGLVAKSRVVGSDLCSLLPHATEKIGILLCGGFGR